LASRGGLRGALAAGVLLLAAPVGCGDDDDGNDNNNERQTAPVAGTFVGKLGGSGEFVAVVAAPPAKGQDRRGVTTFVCDAEQVCEWFAGSAEGNDVVTKSEDGKTQAKVTLTKKAASGSVQLPDGTTGRYKASEATATAGLYDLKVSQSGKVTGASAAGVGLTGRVTLPPPGTGQLKLADGTRLRLQVRANRSGEPALEPGQLRLIVLPEGDVRGAGKSPGEGGADFYVRSSPKSK
jgi:acetylornithine deacetylase/succinyl-diaminopimelate desuccinylase-like protein